MNACSNSDILKVVYFFSIIIDIIKIIIPIALIIYGLFDFSKAIINSDEKSQKISVILFFKRILYAILVFAVPWIVETFMITLGDLLSEEGTINFTDCLDNANSVCLTAMDSKDIDTIKKACDVPDDYKIEEITNNNNNNSNSNSNNNIVTSDKKITFSYKWVTTDVMPYALYTPSSARNNGTTPLIVWLHGSGEVNADESSFKSSGLLAVLNNWKLDGFNAYVLCPRSSGDWVKQKNEVYMVINNVTREKNINTNKIILIGHSLGGIGVETIADGNSSFYSALVVLSGFYSGVDHNQFKNIPIRGYVGGGPVGNVYYEHKNSWTYMTGDFKYDLGANNLFILDKTSHGDVPRVAFNLDNNNDNKSDLIEWILKQ